MKTLGSKSLLLNLSVAILPNHFWTKNAWKKFGRTHPFFEEGYWSVINTLPPREKNHINSVSSQLFSWPWD